jgi:hypothetical protein
MAFERQFEAVIGRPAVAAVASGTAAIHLGLRLLGVGPGDEVFRPWLRFVARYLSAGPVLLDGDYETWNVDPELVRRAPDRRADAGRLLFQTMYDVDRTALEFYAIYLFVLGRMTSPPEEFNSLEFLKAMNGAGAVRERTEIAECGEQLSLKTGVTNFEALFAGICGVTISGSGRSPDISEYVS